MAVPTNTRLTYGDIGIREEILDKIYRITPWVTPTISMIGRSKIDSTFPEWQTEALTAVDLNNAVLEGDDASNDVISPTVRVGNRTQLSDKVISVSSTDDAVKKAGKSTETGHQLARKGLELRRDMEGIVCNNQASVAGADAVAPKIGGLPAWLTTNVSRGATGANGGYASGVVAAATDGTLRALSMGYLDSVLELEYTNGGTPEYVMMAPGVKRRLSAFLFNATTVARIQTDTPQGEAAKAVGAVDAYETDWGPVMMVPNRLQRPRDVFCLDPSLLEIGELQPFKEEALAKTGHSNRRMLSIQWTLKVFNEAAQGIIADIDSGLAVTA